MRTGRDNKKFEAGFSLLELLLVVGIGALLLLAGIATYRLVTSGNNVNDAVRILTTIKTETQRAFQGQSTYGTADLVEILSNLNAFPSGVVVSGNPVTAEHPWGGQILVVGANNQFTVEYEDVPESACIRLGTTFDDNDSDFVSLDIGNNTDVTIDTVSLDAACDPNEANNDMLWTFF